MHDDVLSVTSEKQQAESEAAVLRDRLSELTKRAVSSKMVRTDEQDGMISTRTRDGTSPPPPPPHPPTHTHRIRTAHKPGDIQRRRVTRRLEHEEGTRSAGVLPRRGLLLLPPPPPPQLPSPNVPLPSFSPPPKETSLPSFNTTTRRRQKKQLKEQHRALTREIHTLDKGCDNLQRDVAGTDARVTTLSAEAAHLASDAERMRDDLVDIDQQTLAADITAKKESQALLVMRCALDAIRERHDDLKQYAAHKYFPEGEGDATGNLRYAKGLERMEQEIERMPTGEFDGNRVWASKGACMYKKRAPSRSPSRGASPSPLLRRSVSPSPASLLRRSASPMATPRGGLSTPRGGLNTPRSLTPRAPMGSRAADSERCVLLPPVDGWEDKHEVLSNQSNPTHSPARSPRRGVPISQLLPA